MTSAEQANQQVALQELQAVLTPLSGHGSSQKNAQKSWPGAYQTRHKTVSQGSSSQEGEVGTPVLAASLAAIPVQSSVPNNECSSSSGPG